MPYERGQWPSPVTGFAKNWLFQKLLATSQN